MVDMPSNQTKPCYHSDNSEKLPVRFSVKNSQVNNNIRLFSL